MKNLTHSLFIKSSIVLLLLSVSNCTRMPASEAEISQGQIDLSHFDFSENTVRLTGEFEFYWNKTATEINPRNDDAGPSQYAVVPGAWNLQEISGEKYPRNGMATYRAVIQLPENPPDLALYSNIQGTAWQVFVNGRKIGHSGKVGRDAESHEPYFRLSPAHLPEIENGRLDLRIEISNFSDQNAGFWNEMWLGNSGAIDQRRIRLLSIDFFSFAAILAIGLYHFIIFLGRREDRPAFWFATVCLLVSVRALLGGERPLELMFDALNFELLRKAEYISFYLAVPAFLTFLTQVMNEPRQKILVRAVWPVPILLSLLVLMTPLSFYSHTLIPTMIYTFFWILIGMVIWIRAIRRQETGAVLSFLGGLVFAASALNDMLFAMEISLSGNITLAPFGLFVLIMTQSYMIANIFARAFQKVKELSETLIETNRSFARFVPTNFLTFLNRPDIQHVRLGDQSEQNMAIMFSDIRSFTSISETMSPSENFHFLNSYLARVVPVISRNHGFVDKYIGDAVMSLFPDGPNQALIAAIEMQSAIRDYSHELTRQGRSPLQVGIGIHTGHLILGTIGSEERMEGTVISDAVNTASRIEDLTKLYDSPIIVSQAVIDQLKTPDRFLFRKLDSIKVKGKSTAIVVYEIYNGQPDYVINLFHQTKDLFEKGLRASWEQDWLTAAECMKTVLEINPGDRAAEILLEKAMQPD